MLAAENRRQGRLVEFEMPPATVVDIYGHCVRHDSGFNWSLVIFVQCVRWSCINNNVICSDVGILLIKFVLNFTFYLKEIKSIKVNNHLGNQQNGHKFNYIGSQSNI